MMERISKHKRKEWLYTNGFGLVKNNKFQDAWNFCADKLNLQVTKNDKGIAQLKVPPTYLGKQISLAMLVKKAMGDDIKIDRYPIKRIGYNLSFIETNNALFQRLLSIINKDNYYFLDTKYNADALLKFCLNAKNRVSNIIVPICPNWSIDVNGNYDFKTCNFGNSLVGKRAINRIKQLHAYFAAENISVKFHILIGDYEGRNKFLQKKYNLSLQDFYERFDSTILAIKVALDNTDIMFDAGYLTDIAGSYNKWEICLNWNKNLAADKSIESLLKCSRKNIKRYLYEREGLFKRIFSYDSINNICKNQLAEYSTIAELVSIKFENPLLLGCDSISTAYGYHCMGVNLPILYIPESRISA